MPDHTLTTADLQVGATYRGKRPRRVGTAADRSPTYNDRTILWLSGDGSRVQYDGPAVALGRNYPTVSADDFLAWAGQRLPVQS